MAFLKGKKDENTETVKKEKAIPSNASFALRGPRISEKASKGLKDGKYVFNVEKKANKIDVKKAVENAYKVKVLRVNMVLNKGKVRNFGRVAGKTSGFKKAIVTLKSGDKIDL